VKKFAMAIPNNNEQGGIFGTINITPLTDIFLVLLIIFMVATAISIESAAHVELPQLQAPASNEKPKGVTVTYTADHRIFVNGKLVNERELGSAVHDALGAASEKLVVFDGDPAVILGDMVTILDISKRAGAEQIALAISKSSESSAGSRGGVGPTVPEPESVAPAPEPVAPSGGNSP
jgi:biopolymer transport protein ExbD